MKYVWTYDIYNVCITTLELIQCISITCKPCGKLCSQFTGSVFARSLKFNFKYFVLIKKIKLIIQLVRSSLTSCCIQIFIWDWKGLSQFHIWQKTFKKIFHTLIYSVRVKHVTCVCMRSTSVKPFGIRRFQVIMSK